MRIVLGLTLGALLLAGCNDRVTSPVDTAPAAPRGVHSVTGDGEVTLSWLANTENDIAGYRIYEGDCPDGPQCPYDRIGVTTATTFVVTPLTNGVTRFYAVAAVDRAGHESDLSYDTIFDTPRPAGTGLTLSNANVDTLRAGYDFSAYTVRPYHDPQTDIYYGGSGGQALMIAPFTDTQIQDAGFATTLDAVDFAPTAGWSPSGTVELIPSHCYVVWTSTGGEDHYAKFRVTALTANQVTIDWAYQVAPGNRELRSRPNLTHTGPRVRRVLEGALAAR